MSEKRKLTKQQKPESLPESETDNDLDTQGEQGPSVLELRDRVKELEEEVKRLENHLNNEIAEKQNISNKHMHRHYLIPLSNAFA